MAILGILYGQKKTVIDSKDSGLGGVLGQLQGVLRQTVGGVAGIVVDATINEEHVQVLDITENEVESGVDVTDHSQLKPAQLTIEGVISDTPLGYAVIGNIQNVVRTVETLFGRKSRSVDAYNDLLALQKSRTPFTVTTGLRRYTNMMLMELSVPRTPQTGQAIHFRAVMKEVRFVSLKTISPPVSLSVSSLAAPIVDKGNKVTPAVDAGSSFDAGQSTLSGAFQSFEQWLFSP